MPKHRASRLAGTEDNRGHAPPRLTGAELAHARSAKDDKNHGRRPRKTNACAQWRRVGAPDKESAGGQTVAERAPVKISRSSRAGLRPQAG